MALDLSGLAVEERYERTLLPAGAYRAEVSKAEYGVSKKGNEMVTLTWTILSDAEGDTSYASAKILSFAMLKRVDRQTGQEMLSWDIAKLARAVAPNNRMFPDDQRKRAQLLSDAEGWAAKVAAEAVGVQGTLEILVEDGGTYIDHVTGEEKPAGDQNRVRSVKYDEPKPSAQFAAVAAEATPATAPASAPTGKIQF